VVKCEAYAASTIPLSALLALIENEQRSAAWVREVEALRCLIDEGVGLTLDDLAAFGFDRATLSERLKIAQLPVPLLNRVLKGDVSREVARKLARLTQAQQERVVGLAEAGEEITGERVNNLLRAQINAGLEPIQAALAQGWNAPPSHLPTLSNSLPLTTPGYEEQAGQAACAGKESASEMYPSTATTSMTSLLAALHAFAQSPDCRTTPQAVRTLIQALEQQLCLALREARSSSQSDPTTFQPQS